MNVLEKINSDKRFTPDEVIQNEITQVIARMHDLSTILKAENGNECFVQIIEDYRSHLTRIRQALEKLHP